MMLGPNVRETLDYPYSRFPNYFGNPVSEFPLTYRSELIDGDSALFGVGAEGIEFTHQSTHKPNYTALGT